MSLLAAALLDRKMQVAGVQAVVTAPSRNLEIEIIPSPERADHLRIGALKGTASSSRPPGFSVVRAHRFAAFTRACAVVMELGCPAGSAPSP